MKNIIKRDGRLVSFDESKIYNAVLKAADSVSEDIEHNKAISESVKRRVIKELDTTYLDNNYPTVEEIQDLVIKMLINSREDKIANAYISYRNDRTRKREAKNKLMEGIKEITFASSKDSNLKRDNGNVNGDTPMGMMLQYGSLVSKQFSDDYLISEKIAKHMKDGDIYIHDKDFLPSGTLTCCQIPLDRLFSKGFNTGHGYIRPPQSIRSYASLAAIAIQSNQNDQHGGQSIPLFDYYLAPGITKTLKKEFENKLQILFFALAQKKEDEKIEKIMESFSLDDFKLKNEAKLKLKLKEKMIELVNPQEADWLIDQAFSLALQATEKETYQAMESFIHNLNTMHCLPYHENIWVYDSQEKKLLLMSIGKLTENFEKDRYYAISLNTTTQDAEFKKITAAQRKDNHRRIITLITKGGQTVTTTDNHRILSYDEKCNCIVEKFPEAITHTLTPTCHNYEKLLETCDEETLQPLLNVIKALSSSIDGHVKGNYMLYSIEITSKAEYNSHDEYVYDISVEDNENFLTKDCIFVHNSRAGAQVPFSSINFGMDISEEGRMVSRNLLLAQEAGLGNGETPIFPILIFQVKEGVNYNPGDHNYDLFQLSLRVSAKRLFPNFVFVDAPFNLQYYTPEDPETIIATMGCVDKDEVITYKINKELYVESFSRAWNRLINLFEIKKNGLSEYLDLKNVTIYDSSSNDFVECKKMIRNPDMNNWYKVKFSGGRTLTATADHPLPIKNKGRTFVQDLEISDEITPICYQFSNQNINMDTDKAWLLGLILCDSSYQKDLRISLGLDEQDIVNKAVDVLKAITKKNVNVKKQYRGVKGKYIDIVISDKELCNTCKSIFEGVNKIDRKIPKDVFNYNKEAKLAFLAGIIDADGYLNQRKNKNCRVQLGSTNKELAIQQAILANSLGFTSKIYENYYKKGTNKIRYRVEFLLTKELFSYIISNKKKQKVSSFATTSLSLTSKVEAIEFLGYRNEFSYDVETSSDFFDVSGILSHNCRTRVIGNVNGKQTPVGRGNLSFTTINLPRLGIKHGYLWRKREEKIEGYDRESFFLELDSLIDICIEQLLERYELQKKRKVRNFPFLMGQGVWRGSEKLTSSDELGSIIDSGTLSVGFIGLAECLVGLTGHHHGESEQLQNFGLEIIGHMRERMDEATEKYHLNFSLLGTPRKWALG